MRRQSSVSAVLVTENLPARINVTIIHALPLMRLGLEPEPRRYAPHVTLARLKQVAVPRLQEFLRDHALFRAEPFLVQRFSLIASYPTKSGAIYEDQADYDLT